MIIKLSDLHLQHLGFSTTARCNHEPQPRRVIRNQTCHMSAAGMYRCCIYFTSMPLKSICCWYGSHTMSQEVIHGTNWAKPRSPHYVSVWFLFALPFPSDSAHTLKLNYCCCALHCLLYCTPIIFALWGSCAGSLPDTTDVALPLRMRTSFHPNVH